MTERTFRSPSPDRQNSTAPMDVDEDAPPVPPVPTNVSNSHRRSASVEPPQRIMSPTPGTGKRGSSVDRASMPPKITTRPAKRLSNVNEEQTAALEPPSSPSRNFSRPMSRDGTYAAAVKNKYTHGQGSWFTQAAGAASPNGGPRPKSSDGGSRVNAPGIEIPITNPRKKNRISSAPGSHLTQANQGSVTASEPTGDEDAIMVFDPNTRTFITQPREQADAPDSPVERKTEQVYDRNTRTFISRAQAEEPEAPSPSALNIVQTPTSKKTKPSIAALDTTLQPPPKNPARYSPSSESPSSPRAMGFLHKQPSVVREDREAEEKAEASYPKAAQKRTVSQSPGAVPAKSYATTDTRHERSSSLDVPRGDQASRGRNTSLSPQRSTRFSPSPVMDATRHDPPGRGVSPVKSALKHSPASSVRAASPLLGAGPPSESDTMSDIGSQDGIPTKRKKSVRVSFDEHAPQISPTPPTLSLPFDDPSSDDDAIMKPRPALPSFGSVRSQRMSPEPAEKVTEMPPDREGSSSDTALGSILAGSLRGEGKKVERENNAPQDPVPPEVTSREMAEYASDASSDLDIPAPAANTNSDADVPEPAANASATETATKDFALGTLSASNDPPRPEDDAYVPEIALQPPTPGNEDDSKKDLQAPVDTAEDGKPKDRLSRDLSMPGGWGYEEEENLQQASGTPKADLPLNQASETSAATSTTAPLAPTTVDQGSSHELSDISEDSDDSAAFSDAAEDLSDLEDGGFASLDAIVESPMLTSTPLPKKGNLEELKEIDESPSVGKTVAKPEDAEGKKPADWGEATAYWSKLSRQQRAQIERDHMSEDDEPNKPAPTKAKKKQPSAGQAPAKPALKQTSPKPKQNGGMRKSMRATAAPTPAAADSGVHMRRSMRAGGGTGGGMMTSMREGPPQPRQRPQSEHLPEPRGALQKRDTRPKSSSGLPASASGTAIRQSLRPGSSDSATRPLPMDSAYPPLLTKRASQQSQSESKTEPPIVSKRLQKELSKADDSDSESSFRKRRRNRAGSASTMDSRGGFSMRKSMRGAPPEAGPATAAPPARPTSPDMPRGSKWRMRSMSPTGSFFGRNKQSPRPNIDSGTRTTLRAQPPAARNTPTPAARVRPSTASAATPSATSRFKSRFAADSDDEDDGRPARTFQSRFADSDDDDDDPANLTPVRGIPKRSGQEDGDSTDLDEEEDNDPRKKSRQRQKQSIPLVPDPSDVEKAMAAARRNLGISETKSAPSETNQGSALQQGSLRKKAQPSSGSVEASPQTARIAAVPPPPLEKKKRSFMGSILRRNRNSTASIPQAATSTSAATAGEKTPTAPSSPSASPMANKLRRPSDQHQPPTRMKRGDSDLSTATAPEMYHSPNNRDSTNWPLAPPVPKIPEHLSQNSGASQNSPSSPADFNAAKEDQVPSPEAKHRPSTSDGVSNRRAEGVTNPNEIRLAKTMRPGGPQRTLSEQVQSREERTSSRGRVSFLAGDEGSEPGERPADLGKGAPVYSRRTGKKKKFGMLRKVFGLDD